MNNHPGRGDRQGPVRGDGPARAGADAVPRAGAAGLPERQQAARQGRRGGVHGHAARADTHQGMDSSDKFI